MTADEYLASLRERLAGGYDVDPDPILGGRRYSLYARSKVVASKYVLHRSISYERMEMYEHVLCDVLPSSATATDVDSFVRDLKGLVDELVRPSYEHMSSALTGVLIAERGFASDAARKVAKSGFTRSFWLGLRGWCFLRLLGIDLATGQVWANRRGKEVMHAYTPGEEGRLRSPRTS